MQHTFFLVSYKKKFINNFYFLASKEHCGQQATFFYNTLKNFELKKYFRHETFLKIRRLQS